MMKFMINNRTDPWKTDVNLLTHVTFCRVIDGKLVVKTALPGLKIEYSTDEGVTWNDVTQETKVKGEIRLRTR